MRLFGARAAATGVSSLTIALALLIQPWEGTKLKPYKDSGGIWTVCTGVTGVDVIPGKTYTKEECDILDAKHAFIHYASVKSMLPITPPVPVYTEAAFISFHYNVGAAAFKSSTLLRKVKAGDLKGACNELPRWVKVKGVTLRGLENRRFLGDSERLSERTLCLIGVDPSYRTPLFDRLIMKVKK